MPEPKWRSQEDLVCFVYGLKISHRQVSNSSIQITLQKRSYITVRVRIFLKNKTTAIRISINRMYQRQKQPKKMLFWGGIYDRSHDGYNLSENVNRRIHFTRFCIHSDTQQNIQMNFYVSNTVLDVGYVCVCVGGW